MFVDGLSCHQVLLKVGRHRLQLRGQFFLLGRRLDQSLGLAIQLRAKRSQLVDHVDFVSGDLAQILQPGFVLLVAQGEQHLNTRRARRAHIHLNCDFLQFPLRFDDLSAGKLNRRAQIGDLLVEGELVGPGVLDVAAKLLRIGKECVGLFASAVDILVGDLGYCRNGNSHDENRSEEPGNSLHCVWGGCETILSPSEAIRPSSISKPR